MIIPSCFPRGIQNGEYSATMSEWKYADIYGRLWCGNPIGLVLASVAFSRHFIAVAILSQRRSFFWNTRTQGIVLKALSGQQILHSAKYFLSPKSAGRQMKILYSPGENAFLSSFSWLCVCVFNFVFGFYKMVYSNSERTWSTCWGKDSRKGLKCRASLQSLMQKAGCKQCERPPNLSCQRVAVSLGK